MKPNPTNHPIRLKLSSVIVGLRQFPSTQLPLVFDEGNLTPAEAIHRLQRGLDLFAVVEARERELALATQELERGLPRVQSLAKEAEVHVNRHFGGETKAKTGTRKPGRPCRTPRRACAEGDLAEEVITTITEEVIVGGARSRCGCESAKLPPPARKPRPTRKAPCAQPPKRSRGC